MSKSYKDKLLDPRWQKKRLEILERDGWRCRYCGNDKLTLHVHHVLYLKGVDPWDYEDADLHALCEDCHLLEKRRDEMDYQSVGLLRQLGVSALAMCGVLGLVAKLRTKGLTALEFNRWSSCGFDDEAADRIIEFIRSHPADIEAYREAVASCAEIDRKAE